MAEVHGESAADAANAQMASLAAVGQPADDDEEERGAVSAAPQHPPPTNSTTTQGRRKSCSRVCSECRARAAGMVLDSGTAAGGDGDGGGGGGAGGGGGDAAAAKTAPTDPDRGGVASKHHHRHHYYHRHDEEDRYCSERPVATEKGRQLQRAAMDTEFAGDKTCCAAGGGAGDRRQPLPGAALKAGGGRGVATDGGMCQPPPSAATVNTTPMEVSMDGRPHAGFKDPAWGQQQQQQQQHQHDNPDPTVKTTKLCHADSSSSIASLESSVSAKDKSLKAKRKKKFGNKKKATGDAISEGEFDDTSSEHSVSSLKPKKKARKCKKHCDKHFPKDASKASCDGTEDGDSSKQKTDDVVCTCGKSSKRLRMRVRPEPEGGSSHTAATISAFMDEFDRVIFSNEPIFSDMEFDAKEDAQIRSEMERYHKRSNHPDIFSAARMVNTNTMLKFAIIGAELQNISSVSLRRVTCHLQRFLSTHAPQLDSLI